MKGFKTSIEVNLESNNKLWKNIMYSWLSINREYMEDLYDEDKKEYVDCAYWYNERTCVGILAGAIWRRGGICLEEFISVKGKNKRDGRTDLYFYIGDEEYIVEAKFIYSNNVNKQKIMATLFDAISDCEESKYHEGKKIKGMAIVFVIPNLKNLKIDYNSIKDDIDLFCSLENTSGEIKDCNGNIANSCYIIGKEVKN